MVRSIALLFPVVVVVMVAAGDAAAPQTLSMVQTLERSLEAGSTVLVQETSSVPSDLAAEAVVASQSAGSVVVVSWPGRARARVHVRSTSGTWATREIEFGPGDEAAERGRTVGLIAATMVPGDEVRPLPTPGPRPPVRGMVGLGLAVAPGLDSSAWGVGPVAYGGVRIAGPVWLDGAVQGRFGRHDAIGAASDELVAEGGAAVRFFPGRWLVGAGATLGVAWVQLRRAGEAAGRPFPTLSLPLEAGWLPGPLGVVVSLRPEFSLGVTRVEIAGVQAQPLPSVRLRAEVSGRVFF